MKLHYISGSLIPSTMANAVHVMKMSQAFAKAGNDVTLFGKGDGNADNFQIYGVAPCFKLRLSPGRSGIIRHIHTFVKGGRPDLFYGRDALALYALSFRGIPCIWEAHQIPEQRLKRFIVGKLLEKTRRLVVISERLKEDMLATYPFLKSDEILVAHDGADMWQDTQLSKPENWQGRTDSIFAIGYTGSLHKGKGLEIILQLAPHVPEVDFHVIGGNPAQIEAISSPPENVLFYGHQPHDTLKNYLAHCDALIAPYQKYIHIAGSNATIGNWISPLKLFEYMAAQKPVLCSDLPVLHEILEDNENALLCDPDNLRSWVTAIKRLQADKALAKKLAKNAYNDFKDHYTWDSRARRILDFIKDSP